MWLRSHGENMCSENEEALFPTWKIENKGKETRKEALTFERSFQKKSLVSESKYFSLNANWKKFVQETHEIRYQKLVQLNEKCYNNNTNIIGRETVYSNLLLVPKILCLSLFLAS